MMGTTVDRKVYNLAYEWLHGERELRQIDPEVGELAQWIQDAIELWEQAEP